MALSQAHPNHQPGQRSRLGRQPANAVLRRRNPPCQPAGRQLAAALGVASVAGWTRSGTQEIAALGQQPNRVQATDHPTTRPIAASVAGTVPAPQPDDGSLASPTAASTAPPPVTAATARSQAPPSRLPQPPETDDNRLAPMHEAEPTAAGERSLVRTLGLKIGRIVIDAGHGGHDSGTTGPGGLKKSKWCSMSLCVWASCSSSVWAPT